VGFTTTPLAGHPVPPIFNHLVCNILAEGSIGLIGYSHQQIATYFLEAHLQRTPKLSVLGQEQFKDG
jgi:hypothetical protein